MNAACIAYRRSKERGATLTQARFERMMRQQLSLFCQRQLGMHIANLMETDATAAMHMFACKLLLHATDNIQLQQSLQHGVNGTQTCVRACMHH